MSATKHSAKAGYLCPHPSLRRESLDVVGLVQKEDLYTQAYLESVTTVHEPPRTWYDRLAWWWLLAGTSGGNAASASERQLARRAQLFCCDGQATALAAVCVLHVRCMLTNQPDNGWVHTLAMEVECMRCQHAVWTQVAAPSLLERLLDLFVCANLFLQCCAVYAVSPSVIHAYQVHRAEEDMWWHTTMLQMLEHPGRLRGWESAAAPPAARAYNGLPSSATLKDALLRMRADAASIRHINRVMAGLRPGEPTPVAALRQFGSSNTK